MPDRTYRCPLCETTFVVPPEMQEPVLCSCSRFGTRMELVSEGIDLSPLASDPVFQERLRAANRDVVLRGDEADGEF